MLLFHVHQVHGHVVVVVGRLFHPSTQYKEVIKPTDGVIAGTRPGNTAVSTNVTAAARHSVSTGCRRPAAGRQTSLETYRQAL